MRSGDDDRGGSLGQHGHRWPAVPARRDSRRTTSVVRPRRRCRHRTTRVAGQRAKAFAPAGRSRRSHAVRATRCLRYWRCREPPWAAAGRTAACPIAASSSRDARPQQRPAAAVPAPALRRRCARRALRRGQRRRAPEWLRDRHRANRRAAEDDAALPRGRAFAWSRGRCARAASAATRHWISCTWTPAACSLDSQFSRQFSCQCSHKQAITRRLASARPNS